jgi:mRNA interferase MazF
MRRGDIWIVAGGKDYVGKPRPVVIVQDDSFDATDSITICAFTTDETDAPLVRLPVEPNERNGLRAACRLMVDKITTVPKTKVGARVGGWTMKISCGLIRPCSCSSDWRSLQGQSRGSDEQMTMACPRPRKVGARLQLNQLYWRKEWDSNPRGSGTPCWFSRPVP